METNLFDRYIAEIGKRLPIKDRSDIQKEIRSTLEDMLEERAQKAGGTATEEMVVDLLKEFGKPEDVAASYFPERHLIGPQLYPVYTLILKIVLPILAAVLLVTMSIAFFTTQMDALETLKAVGRMLSEVLGALVSAFGFITLAFGILERLFGPEKVSMKIQGELQEHIPGMKYSGNGGKPEEWNPRHLPEARDLYKFSIPGMAVEIALTLVAIVIFNFFPQIISYTPSLNTVIETGSWEFVTVFPILSEAFFRYMPYLNALWGFQIVLNLFLLQRGRWETTTRWLHITLTVLGIALAAVMLAGPDLVGPIGDALRTLPGFDDEAANILSWIPSLMVRVALGISILVNGIEAVKSVIIEITHKAAPEN